LHYLVISVNGELPVAVADGQTLLVRPGDSLEVVHVGSNYDRGLSVDVLGQGSLNDIRLPLRIDGPTSVIARRDNVSFGQVRIDLLPPGSPVSPRLQEAGAGSVAGASAGYLPGGRENGEVPVEAPAEVGTGGPRFLLEVDGEPFALERGRKLSVLRGAKVRLVDVEGSYPPGAVMNLRGFVGRPGDVSGNDKGTVCDTARDMLPRFALDGASASLYQLGLEQGKTILAKAYIEILGPRLKSVTLESGGQEKTLLLGQRWFLKPGTLLTVKSVSLEGDLPISSPRFTLGGRPFPASLPQSLTMPPIAVSLAVFSGNELAGKVVLAPPR
jgi:hypothetical protein